MSIDAEGLIRAAGQQEKMDAAYAIERRLLNDRAAHKRSLEAEKFVRSAALQLYRDFLDLALKHEPPADNFESVCVIAVQRTLVALSALGPHVGVGVRQPQKEPEQSDDRPA